MSNIPDGLLYTKDHEWVNAARDTATVGITDYAQESLGDITFIELPQVGDTLAKGDAFGVVESVKAASDLYMPLSGEILEVNEALDSSPETANSDPYEAAWMIKIRISNVDELDDLLTPAAYAELL